MEHGFNRRDNNNTKKDENVDFSDMYDIAKAIISVASKHDVLNSDFTMANLTNNVFENKAIVYIRDQLNIMVAINNHFDKKGDQAQLEKIQKLLLDEVVTTVNLSRADMGIVLKALLDYVRGSAGQPVTSEVTTPSVMQKGASAIGLGKKKE